MSSSNLSIKHCLFSQIPPEPPFSIDTTLPPRFCRMQKFISFCHPVQPIRHSVLGPQLLNEWSKNGRNEGRTCLEAHAIYAIFVVVIFWPLLSLNSLLQVLPSPRWLHYVKIFNTLASFFLNIGNNNHHFTASCILGLLWTWSHSTLAILRSSILSSPGSPALSLSLPPYLPLDVQNTTRRPWWLRD